MLQNIQRIKIPCSTKSDKMFESEDWDLDQDFLNDVDEKATQYYSQSMDEDNEPAKRRKVEIASTEFNSSSSLSSQNEVSKLPRKNFVLSILQNKDSGTQNSKGILSDTNNANLQKTEPKIQVVQSSSVNSSRNQLVLNVLKPSTLDNTRYERDVTKLKSPNKKVTLVRKFPGPAGLLPDNIDASLPSVPYLKNLEESKNDRLNDSRESNLPEYCSQRTTNLFTEGAWQLMQNDLPGDFLQGYEIATIKEVASKNRGQSMKVKFLAGMLEHIDHSHENTSIVLKDFTGTIQGIMHGDILLKYPGLLVPNVVILLRDVGLLKISKSVIANKYQILISPSSLLCIYSNEGKIVRTPHMDSIVGKSLNKEVTGKSAESKKQNDSDKGSILNFDESLNETFESVNFDLFDDTSFDVPFNPVIESQDDENFKSPTTSGFVKHSNKKLDEERSPSELSSSTKENTKITKEKSENLMKILKKFSPTANKVQSCEKKIENIQSHSKLSVRSKLLQYKSDDILTPAESENFAAVSSKTKSFQDTLQVNDSDDEMLSQLDVDVIFSNCEKSE